MARTSLLKYVLPLILALLLAGLFHLVPVARRSVEKIDAAVSDACSEAGASDKETCVEALTSLLESGRGSFEQRNRAIWTLGQLADPRALPALEPLRTGIPCKRPCRKDDHICQYELDKAIRWCRGEAWLMRGLRYTFDSPW